MPLHARSVIEHLGVASGLADRNCPESCPSLRPDSGGWCDEWNQPIRKNQNGPVRCFYCCRAGDLRPRFHKERND